MESKVVKDPQIFISKDARKLFDSLQEYNEFKGLENKDMFMLALMFGYSQGKRGRKELKANDRTTSGYTRERYLTDIDNGILKAIAVAETEKIELINNIPEVYAIAEEYANGGVEILKELFYEDPGSFIKKFAEKIRIANKSSE